MSNSKDREALRINGYSVDAAGAIECCREPRDRYAHEHCAVIRLDIGDSKPAREFVAKIVAAVDEPGALVGTSRKGALMLFRVIGSRYEPVGPVVNSSSSEAKHEFVFEGGQCSLIATAAEQTI